MGKLESKRDELLSAAANYLSAEKDRELRPDNPNGDAHMELAQEVLDHAVVNYGKLVVQEGVPHNHDRPYHLAATALHDWVEKQEKDGQVANVFTHSAAMVVVDAIYDSGEL